MSQDRLFVWKSHWAHNLDGTGSQEISRVGETLSARLMETQIWCLPASSVGGRGYRAGQQRNNGSASTAVWEKASPPALALRPDGSVTPHMSQMPFELLPKYWSSEGVSPSMPVQYL